eukprot:TRINITY_DN1852_c0_g1_i1.p1 TRINITY_DN1852_c0_g1~~TRINITY_DN1852_c0_g1_i1.p1  ORF type:complete len:631 (+),score=180.82 TRINITY_DN1852_c0_g1_i1:72-1895(+)
MEVVVEREGHEPIASALPDGATFAEWWEALRYELGLDVDVLRQYEPWKDDEELQWEPEGLVADQLAMQQLYLRLRPSYVAEARLRDYGVLPETIRHLATQMNTEAILRAAVQPLAQARQWEGLRMLALTRILTPTQWEDINQRHFQPRTGAPRPDEDYAEYFKAVTMEATAKADGSRVGEFLMAAIRANLPRTAEVLVETADDAALKSIKKFTDPGAMEGAAVGCLPNVIAALAARGFSVEGDGKARHATPLGALVKAVCTSGVPVRMEAAFDQLIRLGADPSGCNPRTRFTPLICAVGHSNQRLAQLLLDAGADANFGTSAGKTPLLVAVERGTAAMCEFLLSRGADVNQGNNRGLTPLMAAVLRGEEAYRVIMDSAGVDVRKLSAQGKTALHYAAEKGNEDWTRELLLRGADVNAATDLGMTPLMLAASRGDVSMIQHLLDNAADVNAATGNNETALMMACSGGGGVEALTAAGAEVNTQTDFEGKTALMCLTSREEGTDVVKKDVECLLKAGADVAVKCHLEKRTALHYAAARGWTAVCGTLLDAGGALEAKDRRGMTPLLVAREEKRKDAYRALEGRGASTAPFAKYSVKGGVRLKPWEADAA